MENLAHKKVLAAAVDAARAVGKLMRANLRAAKTINASTQYDIKLELDVRCQKLIEKLLRRTFPKIALLGEEGDSGATNEARRWVVDPIDGTVNFAYGIPHACVSIALQEQAKTGDYETIVGVVHDPFTSIIAGFAKSLNCGLSELYAIIFCFVASLTIF